jgi:hypothetical protein
MTAQAMSLRDFNAKSTADRSAYVDDFIDKMTTDLRAKNQELAQSIRTWFAVKPECRTLSEAWSALTSNSAPSRFRPSKAKPTCQRSSLNPSSCGL